MTQGGGDLPTAPKERSALMHSYFNGGTNALHSSSSREKGPVTGNGVFALNGVKSGGAVVGRVLHYIRAAFILALLFPSGSVIGQLVLISPSGDGGFESATTFEGNNWNVAQGTLTARVWYCGTGQSGFTGARAAFVGNSASTIGTSTASRTVHLYRSITIPAGASDIQLSFKYKQAVSDLFGGTIYDGIRVFLNPSIPSSGILPSSGQVFGPYPSVNITSFTTQSVTIPNSFATGSATNLIFTFFADGVSPHGYGAIDDVSLTYELPTCAGTPDPGTVTPMSPMVCQGGTAVLTASGLSSGSGIQYQWEASLDGSSGWANVSGGSGATSSSYTTGAIDNTTYFRLRTTCTNSGLSNTTNTVTVTPQSCCNYTFRMTDSYGDGWSGAAMQVRQGTTVIATIGSTFNSGNGPVDVLIPLIDGTPYNLFWSTAGSYSYEVGVQILDAQGTEIYSMPFNSSALTGTQLHSFNAACPIPCAGNPSPGNTLSSVASVCSGVSFTLSLQNNPAVTGLTYQWMSSDDGSVWTNISGATTATHTLSQTSATYYKCAVTCDGNTAESSAVQVGQNPPTECYCVPSTTYGCDYGDVVARVILNTLDNNSGTGCPSAELGYSDYTNDPLLTTTLQAGTSYGCTVYAGEYSQGYAAWIDYNDDGIFDNSTERIGYSMGMVTGSGQAGVLGSNATFPVVLACNPPVGSHRLRVRSMYNTSGIAVTPCESNLYGETEDYLITIAAPPPCPAPSALTASGATDDSVQLNWTAGCIETAWEVEYGPVGFTPGNGITVPAGTLPFTLSGLDALTNYHAYVRADCGVDGISTSYGPVAFTTLGPPSCIPAPSFPADGSSTCLGTGSITLSWPTAANATNYTVIVDDITVSANQSGTTYTANGLAAGPHTWSVTPSNSYGSASDCNTWTFDLTAPPSGNTISTALPSGTLPFSTTGDNLAANCWTSTYAGPNNQSSPDVWYAITTECAGELNINVCTSGFDTYAHLLDANGIHIASNDDEPQPGCYFRSSSFTDIPVAGNTTYYLVIEGWSSNTGTFTLSGSVTPADADGDGTCDTNDGCPSDPDKISPGQCGCGSPDTDSDSDGTADCNDACPADLNKIVPGICGCGEQDIDLNANNVCDAQEGGPQVKLGLVHAPGNKLEVRLLPNGDFNTLISNTVITVRWETTPGVSVSSPQYVDPAYMGATGPIISTGTSTDGIYSYATFSTIGFGSLSDAGLAWTANTEVPFFQLNYTNTSDRCVTFEVVDDAYQTSSIINWFISLDAYDRTDGYIPGTTQVISYPSAICQNTTATITHLADATITPAQINESFEGCSGILYSLSQSSFNCSELGEQIVTLTATNPYGVETSCSSTVTVIAADSDGDGTHDCDDLCPTDPDKIAPGVCGCGNVDVDVDNDNVCDTDETEPLVKLGLVHAPGNKLEVRLLPDGFFNDLVSNTVITIRWETTPGVSVSSPQYVDPAYMGATGPIISTGTSTDGIYSYATFSTIGFGSLANAGLAWTANTEVPFFQLNYSNTSDRCVTFEVVDDAYQTAQIISWFISLNALDRTDGYIPGSTQVNAYPEALCQDATAAVTHDADALITVNDVNAGFLGCTGITYSLNNDTFTCADLGQQTVTLTATDGYNVTTTCTATITVISADTDNDGTVDCSDLCPTDPLKTSPGLCGCGVVDVDSDNDNVCDLFENEPNVKLGISEVGNDQLELRLLPDGFFNDLVSNTVITVRWETTPGVSVFSPQYVDPAYLGATGPIISTGISTDDIYSYATFSTIGFGNLSDQGIAWTGGLEVPFFRVNYTNPSGACLDFEVVDDAYQTAENISWYISLNALEKADGYIPGSTSAIGYPAAICQDVTVTLDVNGEATVTPAMMNTGTFLDCAAPILSLDQSLFTCADVGANTVTLSVAYPSGPTLTCSSTVTVISTLEAFATPGEILCNGGSTTVNVTATGGSGTYTGTGPQTVQAGPYSFTVTDSNGCTSTVSGTITEPAALVASASIDAPILCAGGETTITVSATGGTGTISGTGTFPVEAGPYSFTVTDANGCTSTVSGTITEPAALVASASIDAPILCAGGETTITVSATGGTGTISGTGTFPVEAGPYSFTVTDANGCTSTVSGTITEPAVLTVTASSDAIPCPGGSTVVTISATGGTGALEGTGTFTLEAGTYTFSVTDANGCSASTVHEVIFMLQDSDGDGICDDLDQCPGGPEPGTACDDGNPGTIDDVIGNDCLCTGTPAIQIHVRAMLDGPYNTTNGLMNDGLRAGNHLPVSHPYGSAPFNLPASASISPAILTVSGDDAIVDWVIIELRDNIDPSVLVARRAVLLQRDGDVVELDGVNPVLFSEAPGAYHVAIRHRNHFGVMTASSVSLGPVVQLVDFIDPATITFGLDARKELEPGTMALWAGNARVDSQLKYSGAQNDRDPILVKIGGLIPTAVVFGYHVEDVNLNGIVSYAGAGNDRDRILVNLDGSVLGVRIEQMP